MSASPLVADALRRLAADEPLRLTVRGGCMRPLLTDGQQITVNGARRYWPGDVVAFPAASGTLVVHRVIGYRARRGRLLLQTRADATGTLDPPVAARRVIGRLERPAAARPRLADRLLAVARFARLWGAGLLPR